MKYSRRVFSLLFLVLIGIFLMTTSAFAATSIKSGWTALDSEGNWVLQGSQYPLSESVRPITRISNCEKTVNVPNDAVIYLNNNKVGTAQALIIGNKIPGYKDAFITCFKIVDQVDISKATVASIPKQTYTGKAIQPSVTIQYGNTTLSSANDYSVSYSNNTSIGIAKVVIKGKGKYAGSKTATFEIGKANNSMSVSNVSKTIKTSSVFSNAKTLKNLVKASNANGNITMKVIKKDSNKKISLNAQNGNVSVKKGTPGGTYKMTVRVTAAGDATHLSLSSDITVTVKVEKDAATFVKVAQKELRDWKAGKVPEDRYYKWCGAGKQSWCSEFVGYCLEKSGCVRGKTMAKNPSYAAAHYRFYNSHKNMCTIHKNNGKYKPQAGDVVIQICNGQFWHTEMVEKNLGGKKYQVLSGGWKVTRSTRSLDDKSRYYFITIDWSKV